MRYLFKHILMRDTVYDMQLSSRLRDLHRRAAEAIEELYTSDLAPYYADLAHHYEQSGMKTQALDYLHKAGDYAGATYDVPRAIYYYEKALALLPEHETRHDSCRIALYEGLSKMLRLQGRYSEAIATAHEMLAAAEKRDDQAAQARAWYQLSWTQNTQGENQAALASAEQAEKVAKRAGAQVELTNALIFKGWALLRLGDVEAALDLGQQALELSTALNAERKMASAYNLLSTAYDAFGQYNEANRLTREALTIYRQLGSRLEEGVMLNNLGTTIGNAGDYRTAVSIFREARSIAREIGDRSGEMLCLSNLGGILVSLQEYEAAATNLRRAIQIAEDAGIKFPEAYSFLAEAYLGASDLQKALITAKRALALAEESREDIGGAWRALGKVAAQWPEPLILDQIPYNASQCFEKALSIFNEMGAEGERARTLWSWACYEHDNGDPERGRAMWQKAREIFKQLGMRLEVERMDRTEMGSDLTRS